MLRTTPDTGTAHTPGPYEYREDRTIVASGIPIARCYAGRNEAANGALFCASSELLQAVKDLLSTGLNGGNNMRLAFISAGGKELTPELLAKADESERAVVSALDAIARAEGRQP